MKCIRESCKYYREHDFYQSIVPLSQHPTKEQIKILKKVDKRLI